MRYSLDDISSLLRRFVNDSAAEGEWDDFECSKPDYWLHELILLIVAALCKIDPPQHETEFCGDIAAKSMLKLADLIGSRELPRPTQWEIDLLKSFSIPPRYMKRIATTN
jgi:hypothetical protein